MYKRKQFLALLFSDSNKVSIKRFATFLALIHFFTLSFVAIFTKREFLNTNLLLTIIDVDKFIIGIGLGVITAQNIAQYYFKNNKPDDQAEEHTNNVVENIGQ